MADPLLTCSIWLLSQTEAGNMVSEEMVPGTFTRRWVNHASIACPLASSWVAPCPGALEGPSYDMRQWNHSQP